jgi:hypothetical protein
VASLDDLVAWRDALLKARLTGARSIEYSQGEGTRRIEYKSDAEMRNALRSVEAMIAAATSGNAPNTIRFVTSKEKPHDEFRPAWQFRDVSGAS